MLQSFEDADEVKQRKDALAASKLRKMQDTLNVAMRSKINEFKRESDVRRQLGFKISSNSSYATGNSVQIRVG